jgi:predicted nucleic acid-binding Zn ribbon protein
MRRKRSRRRTIPDTRITLQEMRSGKEYAEKVKEKPARPCIDCGASIPPRAQKYCAECKEKHRLINVQQAMKRYRTKE